MHIKCSGWKKKLANLCSYEERKDEIDKDDRILSIPEQCNLLQISRSSLYYQKALSDIDCKIMEQIDILYTEHPYYWTRRISAALKKLGYDIGRKKTRSYMQLMWICAVYPKPKTSVANKQHSKHPYLLKWVAIAHPNHVRSTDITYIKVMGWFVYLLCIIDWFSRKIIAWDVSTTMDIWFCTWVLKKAVESWKPNIFNTDQGSQFTSNEFTQILVDNEIQISMDGKGRYVDNIIVERLWRTIKYEDIYLHDYKTAIDLYRWLSIYIFKYNTSRLHSSLWYNTPDSIYYWS